ncbi:MAG: MerR family transcriptional regulator [Pseudonocardia sp.]
MSASEDDGVGRTWRVGPVADRTGLTVRALHHYDRLGLLTPARRTTAGHRLYDEADVARLYRIGLLRRLGFPLEQIGELLDSPHWQLRAAVSRHLDDLRRRIELALRLRARLSGMATALARHEAPSPDELFAILEEMTMLSATVHGTTALLVYNDLAAAQEYLVRVFGLTAGAVHHDGDGRAVHAEIRAGDQVIWLHPAAEEYRSPRDLGAATGMTVVVVDDVDAHHARSVAAGVEIVEAPVDQDYGVREYGARDLEGQLWYFHTPLS